jgi:hypothetical protein
MIKKYMDEHLEKSTEPISDIKVEIVKGFNHELRKEGLTDEKIQEFVENLNKLKLPTSLLDKLKTKLLIDDNIAE